MSANYLAYMLFGPKELDASKDEEVQAGLDWLSDLMAMYYDAGCLFDFSYEEIAVAENAKPDCITWDNLEDICVFMEGSEVTFTAKELREAWPHTGMMRPNPLDENQIVVSTGEWSYGDKPDYYDYRVLQVLDIVGGSWGIH